MHVRLSQRTWQAQQHNMVEKQSVFHVYFLQAPNLLHLHLDRMFMALPHL